MFDGKLFGEEIVGIVRDYVDKAVEPIKAENESLRARIAELEARPVPEIDLEPVERLIEAEIAKLPPSEPAKEVDMEQVAAMVGEAVAALPPPEKGERGQDGDHITDATVTDEGYLVLSFSSGTTLSAGQVRGLDGTNGKDGAGIIDGFVSREGHLIATLSDGSTRDFGEIIGKDGAPGKDGRDGFGFEDMDACVLDDDRTIELSFRRGEEEKAFTFKWPAMIYRGVFKQGEEYHPGDMVTWGGSLHHCNETTTDKPDIGPWTIAAKKGRDGKDAKHG